MNFKLTVAALALLLGAVNFLAQTPIPVPGQQGQRGPQGQRGQRGAQPAAAPVQQVIAPIANAVEVSGPGPFFETFMDSHDDEKNVQVPSKDVYVPVLDIPTILVPTMRETAQGTGTMQKDNDKLRIYEFAGMAHIDSRVAGAYYPNSKLPISRFPVVAEAAKVSF